MRTIVRHLAVVVPLVLIVLLAAAPVQAQWKVNTFDRAVRDSMFATVFNSTANNTAPNPYHITSEDATTKHEGSASLKNVWRMHNTESWGGLNMLSMTLPTKTNQGFYARNYRAQYGDSTYISWGAGTHLSIWYNNLSPSNATGNAVQMRLHIYEAGPGSNYYKGDSTNYEDWYFQSPLPLNDVTPGWHQLIIPLKDTGTRNSPGDQGFCITDWSATHQNDKLDLDNIIGYTIEWTAGKTPGDTASGIVFYDDLRLEGLGKKTGYEALYSFSNYAKDTADFNSGWNNGGTSKFDFFEEKVDTLLGSSVLGVDWAINVKESWGGGANKEYNLPAGTYWPDISAKKELQLYAKVVTPLTSTKGTIANKITMRFVLFDYSEGSKEEWYTVAPVRLDSIGATLGWQQVRIPLDWIQSNGWGDLKPGRFNTPNGAKDQVMGLDKIGGMKLEFSCSADAGEPNSDPTLTYSGKILLSMVVPSGARQVDKTAPAKVTGVSAITSQPYQNIITWVDVPNERGATYAVWASEKPFTKTTDPGVENIVPSKAGVTVPVLTQLVTHNLIYPKVNQSVSLYYGVTATDSVGNTNDPAVIGPVTNTAKGVPTINWGTVNNFVANGDLAEWSSITPITLSAYSNPPTAYIVTNTTIANDLDCSAKAWLSADANYLYAAFDVTDNAVQIDTTSASTWLQDCPDLFIGLYDWRSAHHGSYQRGAAPDYHLRFSLNKLISDNPGATMLTPGANYIFYVNPIVSGYQVEARIPWSAFKTAGNDTLFVPKEGMRIPIDFEISDNDAGGSVRKGQLDYSQFAEGNSYSDVWRWTYTWIGSKASVTGVNDQPALAYEYKLDQNYPNPFNPSTIIRYSIAQAGPVTVKVFDVLGRVVATLVNGEVQNAGEHQVAFNTSTLRSGTSSGVYFYRIESGSFRDVKKMMLLK